MPSSDGRTQAWMAKTARRLTGSGTYDGRQDEPYTEYLTINTTNGMRMWNKRVG